MLGFPRFVVTFILHNLLNSNYLMFACGNVRSHGKYIVLLPVINDKT